MTYSNRQKKLRAVLSSKSLDGLIIRKKQNISYLTGVRGEDAALFISNRKNTLLTDSRYEEEYKKALKNCSLQIVKTKDMGSMLADMCRETGSGRIGFESENLSYAEYENFKKQLKKTTLIPLKSAVEGMRTIKDEDEIRYIKKACVIGADVMNYALHAAKPGMKETRLKNRIKSYMLENETEPADFEIIAASGPNSSMPHASASGRTIKHSEMIIIDLGASYKGYNSDLTRTAFLGKINARFSHIYGIVLEAQKRAIEKIKPGVRAKDIDYISRQYISNKGMGRYFKHSLGHGIGLETHECPSVSPKSGYTLEKNMVITIEPGIYVPGWGGVRIEDVVLVTKNGCEVLTKA